MLEQDSKRIGRNLGSSGERSNKYSTLRVKYLIAANESEKSSSYINIYPMPPADQSV